MNVYEGESFADVYRDSLVDLFKNPQFESSPRGLACKENTDISLVIKNPIKAFYSNPRRSSQLKYIAAELVWYFNRSADVNFITKYASFWGHIKNDDDTVNSSYGNLLFNPSIENHNLSQYEWALESLIRDKDSRQSIMHFNLPKHQYQSNKDFVCTMYGIFHIRDNKLNFKVSMRSNDAILGTPTDVAFFTVLQQQALLHLRGMYPELELGTYTHCVDSYHVYEKNFELVQKMLENKFISVDAPEVNFNIIYSNSSTTLEMEELYNNIMENDGKITPSETETQNNVMKFLYDNL
jgi:thymidylate synthase